MSKIRALDMTTTGAPKTDAGKIYTECINKGHYVELKVTDTHTVKVICKTIADARISIAYKNRHGEIVEGEGYSNITEIEEVITETLKTIRVQRLREIQAAQEEIDHRQKRIDELKAFINN